jgi:hypothetical protein
MERAGKAVLSALRRVGGSEKPLDFLTALWPAIVGPRLAEQTRPVSWEKGVVQIAVADREWQEQLEQMPGTLRDRINKWWGARVVERVSFLQGKVPRSGRAPKPAEERMPPTVRDLAAVEDLSATLGKIRDPETRRIVGSLARTYLGKKSRGK